MLSRHHRIISCSFVEPPVEEVMSSVNTTTVAIVAPGLLWGGWIASSETHDIPSVLLNESESDSHHTQLQWSTLFQKSLKAWHLHFRWRFQWHFWTLWSSYITAKRWKILTKEMQNKKLFLQVFDLSLSPIFDQNNSTIPSVAIVAPYRSLFLRDWFNIRCNIFWFQGQTSTAMELLELLPQLLEE